MGLRNGLLTASSAFLLGGCGDGQHAAPAPPPPPLPRIPAAVAARLAAEAERVAALPAGSCASRDAAARFRDDVIASIGRIPPRYKEPLASAANSIAARAATCVATEPPPPKDGKHKQKKHGKKHHEQRGQSDKGDGE
jgi:hypothetical protein